MSISITEFNHSEYGKCLSISNEIIKVDITIDRGPFIIYFGFKDDKNLLYTENKNRFEYLGHHLWFSPRTISEPISLEKSVVYTPLSNGVRFTQTLEEPFNVQINIETIFAPETSDFMILHSVQNLSKKPKKISINASTSMNPNGILIVPQCDENTKLFPNRLLALWPYSKTDDNRLFLGNKYITFSHDSKVEEPFKFGTNDESGWAAYVLENNIFIKRFVQSEDARYPNFGCSFESYSDENHISLDTNSAFYLTQPNEIIKHVENWSIFKGKSTLKNCKSDNYIDEFLKEINEN